MTAIGPKQYQQTAVTSNAAKKKKIAQQHVKMERAQANQRGLALLAEKASKEHQEEIVQETDRLSLFNLLSQINRPNSNLKEQEHEVQTLITAESDIKNEDKKSIKDDDKESESGDASDKPITSASYQSLAVLSASLVSNASSQSGAAAGDMTEAKFQQLQNLLSQMAAQVSVDNKRSEFTVTLDPALFVDTQLKIQLDEQGMQVNYSCGHAAETAWFGNNATALSKRLTKALNYSVKVQSSERWSRASE